MGKYAEKHLYEQELIVQVVKRDRWSLVGKWIVGILFCWLLLIPFFMAVAATIEYKNTEFVLTNKRLIRKSGVLNRRAFDVPLGKILNVYVETTFWGRVFNANTIRITTAFGVITDKVRDADDFKRAILGQMDNMEEMRLARQATWTAQALAKLNVGKN
jgi:uncharacterized membrane protein YdbT with pleckstrin-like domain